MLCSSLKIKSKDDKRKCLEVMDNIYSIDYGDSLTDVDLFPDSSSCKH